MTKEAIIENHLEYNRLWAEALLSHEEKNFILLSEREKKKLAQRACGVLPEEEEELFKEILSIPLFSPVQLFNSSREFLENIGLLKKYFGEHITFAFLVSLFSVKNEPVFYPQKQFPRPGNEEEQIIELGRLFHRIRESGWDVSKPNIQDAIKSPEEFEKKFCCLAGLRERLLRKRAGIKVLPAASGFLTLKEALEIYSSTEKRRKLPTLFLALIEAYLLMSLGLTCHFHKGEGGINLIVLLDNKAVYWEIDKPSPLTFVPRAIGKAVNLFSFLFHLVYFQRTEMSFTSSSGHWAKEETRQRLRNLLFLYEVVSPQETVDELFIYEIGRLFFLQRDYIKAEEFTKLAVRLKPDFYQGYCLLGDIYTYRENFKKAINYYQRALLYKPDDPEIHSNLGVAYMKAEDYEKAKVAFNAALNIDPRCLSALYNFGNLFFALGDYENSIAYYKRASRLDGKNPSIIYNLANAYYKKGELLKAEKKFIEAIRIDANNAFAWYNLGIVYRDRGEKEKAVKALERAISLNPNLLK